MTSSWRANPASACRSFFCCCCSCSGRWPITGGWGFYPFLLCGFLWNYFNHDERVNVKRIQVLLLVLALLFSLGQYLEKSMHSPGFQTINKVYSGHLFPGKHLRAASTTR